jgi:hypothetical protein
MTPLEKCIMARMSRMSMSLNEALATDVRQVLRQIQKKPAFAGLVILVLGAGLAVSTAMFSTIRTVIFNPLPYRSPERLVQIVSRWPKTGDQNGWSAPLRDAVDWKATVPAFEDVAAYRYHLVNLTEGLPEALRIACFGELAAYAGCASATRAMALCGR